MVNLPGPSSALRKSGVLATAAQVVEQPVQPKHAPAPSRAVLSDAELVEMHREAQRALSIGVTAYSLDRQITLERELVRACDLDCFDADAISYMLDQIHQMAFPDPTRPPRLVIEAAGDPRE